MNNFYKKVARQSRLVGLVTPLIIIGFVFSLTPFALAKGVDPEEKVYYYLHDHLGGVDAVLDEEGNVVERRDYLPYGSERMADEDLSSEAQRAKEDYGFTGKELDEETGLYYYGARYYDPAIGRFASLDPLILGESKKPLNSVLANPQGLNGYSYVLNNPLRYVDETGEYEDDVHYDLTFYLGTKAGLDFSDALEIAMANQKTDTNSETGPYASAEARKNYHFVSEERLNTMLINAAETKKNEDVGQYLHALQDSYSHAQLSPISHVLFGHSPDKTYKDVKRANMMAQRSFFTLRYFSALKNGIKDQTFEEYDKESHEIWNSVKGDINSFNKAKKYEDKIEKLYPELYKEDDKEKEDE